MNGAVSILVQVLRYVMDFCYMLVSEHVLVIILFTLLTKIILFPVSIWVHRNSIKTVRLMPQINQIKAKYYGDADRIAEEQHALYKKEKYNAFASIIPTFIQILILIGLIRIVNESLAGTSLSLVPSEKTAVEFSVDSMPMVFPNWRNNSFCSEVSRVGVFTTT